MARNKLEDVRDHLIAQLERLSDDTPLSEDDYKRASMVNEIGKTLVDSAKAEALMLKSAAAMGANMRPSGFLNESPKALKE